MIAYLLFSFNALRYDLFQLEKQLDDAHRRLENSEVGRGEGQRQVVELREQLNRSEQDREQLRTRVNDYTHDIQREVSKRGQFRKIELFSQLNILNYLPKSMGLRVVDF